MSWLFVAFIFHNICKHEVLETSMPLSLTGHTEAVRLKLKRFGQNVLNKKRLIRQILLNVTVKT